MLTRLTDAITKPQIHKYAFDHVLRMPRHEFLRGCRQAALATLAGKAPAKENGKAVRTEVGTEAAADADGGSKEKLEGGLFFVCDLEDLKHIRKKLSNIRGPPWMFDVKHAA